MHGLFRQGAFQGTTPREAYFVKCDKETTTQNDINRGDREHPRRLRAAQAGRVRHHQDPADGRTDRECNGGDHGPVQCQSHAFRSVQELQVPREVGRPLCRRRQQGRRPQADHGSRQAPRGAATRAAAASRPAAPNTRPITLERGVTHDTEFEKWANKVWNFGSGLGSEVSLKDFRKDIHDRDLQRSRAARAVAYKVFRCWVSEYQALPDLDANANAVAIQNIKLENEGWERDYEVAEPSEPTFTEPPV